MFEQLPQCVGFIMDGNRRWAKAHGMSPLEGHSAGYQKLKEVVAWTQEMGIPYSIVYAFSSENWKRTEEEVTHLLSLFALLTQEFRTRVHNEESIHTRVRFIGERERFPKELQDSMQFLEESTKEYDGHTLVVAVSYGGRNEIVRAVQALMASGKDPRALTEELFSSYLETNTIPDPDVIIRTGGEQRLSNFLPWQSTYSELLFTPTPWPALEKEEFYALMAAYGARTRNFGV